MNCPNCEWTEEDAAATVKLAYGPMPEDGRLLTGKQIRMFARKVIEDTLKTPTLLGDPDGTPRRS